MRWKIRMRARILRCFKHPRKMKLMVTLMQTRTNFIKIRFMTWKRLRNACSGAMCSAKRQAALTSAWHALSARRPSQHFLLRYATPGHTQRCSPTVAADAVSASRKKAIVTSMWKARYALGGNSREHTYKVGTTRRSSRWSRSNGACLNNRRKYLLLILNKYSENEH